jgi:hypothetical protein
VLTLTTESEIVDNDIKMGMAQRIDKIIEDKHCINLFPIRKKLSLPML